MPLNRKEIFPVNDYGLGFNSKFIQIDFPIFIL